MRPPVGAGRDDEEVGSDVALGRPQHEAVAAAFDAFDVDSLAHGRAGGVALEVADDLVPRHEPVRIGPVVGAARQLHGPVRRHETEAVPAITPGLADAAPLEDDVLDAAACELAADRQSGLAAADDHDASVFHPRETSAGDGSPSGGVETVCRR
jgi:hypothetical protein